VAAPVSAELLEVAPDALQTEHIGVLVGALILQLFICALVGSHDLHVLEGQYQNEPDEQNHLNYIDQAADAAVDQAFPEWAVFGTHVVHVLEGLHQTGQRVNRQQSYLTQKERLISFADAVADPWAVVIKLLNAVFTNWTVAGPGRAHDSTCGALLDFVVVTLVEEVLKLFVPSYFLQMRVESFRILLKGRLEEVLRVESQFRLPG